MADLNQLRSRLRVVVREFLAEEGLLRSQVGPEQCLFGALEEMAVEVGDALTREVLEQELATPVSTDCHCPQCGQEGLRKGERQRSIQTRRGPVDVTEVECYCRPCRRSFFPSVPSPGAGCGV